MTGEDFELMLTEQRQGVAAALVAADVQAVEYTSEVLSPPCACVVPGQPYIAWPSRGDDDLPFGCVRLTLNVLLLVTRDAQKSSTAGMDRLIAKAVAALDEYDVSQVTQPGVVTLNGSKFLGSVITITTTTKEP